MRRNQRARRWLMREPDRLSEARHTISPASTKVRAEVLPAIERQGPIRAWIVDDTGFPKKGRHSVGVARQYCGQLGKQDNCQIAVSLSVANDHASLPIAYRLYLPEGWANDPDRRAKAGVPEDVAFRTKPEIALDQIRAALSAGVPSGVVLADAGYGIDTAFRSGVTAMGLTYVVGIQSSTSLWPPGMRPLPPKPGAGAVVRPRSCAAIPSTSRSRPRNWRRPCPGAPGASSPGARAPTLRSPRASPPCASGRRIGTTGAPHRGPRNGSWSSGREGESEPTKYWLSTLPEDTRSPTSSTRPSCAGASSGITRSSSRRSASVTTKAAAGEASTITPRSRIAAYGFLVSERSESPLGRCHTAAHGASAYPKVIDPAEPPLRPERHVLNSIATIRIRLTVRIRTRSSF